MITKLAIQYCLEALSGKPVPKRFPEARNSVTRFLATALQVAYIGSGGSEEIKAFQMVQSARDISTPRKRVVLENLIERIDGLPERRPDAYRTRACQEALASVARTAYVGLRRRSEKPYCGGPSTQTAVLFIITLFA